MILNKVKMGKIHINRTSTNEILSTLESRIWAGRKSRLFFINAHCFNIAQKKKTYADRINEAEFVLNDGIGMKLGAKILGFNFTENMNGTDFIPKLLEFVADRGYSVFLLGGLAQVAENAANNMLERLPNLRIAGYSDGYFNDSATKIAEINATHPDLLIVGMGVPLQESWISDNWEEINAKLVAGVGAYLDFESGRIPRAPQWIQALRSEWIFRLLIEPRRMWKRYIIGNFEFGYHILMTRIAADKSETHLINN
jgi:N-acetylglucosaminyldiphosphoundecaprenol N-acetyl-beta-D-mannosaminyltransferase